MRVLMKVQIPVEAGNEGVKSGVLPQTIREFADAAKPEAMYFTVADGMRTMFAVIDMATTADMPRLGEPLFLKLNASIEATPCMNAQELAAGLQAITTG
ncbi:MAG: hypothetical protein JWO72_2851 [Caulobacteraceae bacterium]|jgi:hypothetical protein|nr:hypothetical protein [Caulobacteraceae bacterium]